jgi:hypothetical protein
MSKRPPCNCSKIRGVVTASLDGSVLKIDYVDGVYQSSKYNVAIVVYFHLHFHLDVCIYPRVGTYAPHIYLYIYISKERAHLLISILPRTIKNDLHFIF